MKAAWQSTTTLPVPDWIGLTDDHITTIIDWINTTKWAGSRQYFIDHSGQLLSGTTQAALNELALTAPKDLIFVHLALLALAQTPAGIDAAYESLEDDHSLEATASAATAARDADRLQACAAIETLVHGRAFAAALHMILAWLLSAPAGQIPEDWASALPALAARADPAEKDTALTQFSTALDSIQADETVAAQLRRTLGLPPRP